MSQQEVRKRTVRLTATANVEIDAGLVLPVGTYVGQLMQIGVAMFGGKVSWTSPEYTIEFSADELAAMGMDNTSKLISINYDVTKFVRLGQITVS